MKKIFVLVLCFIYSFGFSQQPPFWNEIREFLRQDSAQFPKPNSIVFVGSSSIKFWTTLPQDFSGYPVINRGFGGSELIHAIRYADKIILRYKPKQIVIYSGENDLAANVSADSTVARFVKLFTRIRSALPRTSIIYISIKPSPSRKHLFPQMKEANARISTFLRKKKRTRFIDVFPLMLDGEGQPRTELFKTDMLHMNEKGYAIWIEAIKPHLRR